MTEQEKQEAMEEEYVLWLKQSAFKDVSHLLVDPEQERSAREFRAWENEFMD